MFWIECLIVLGAIYLGSRIGGIGLVTALNPVLGYEKSASIAKEALATGGSVYDLVLQRGWLTKAQLDDMLSPANMTDPRQLPQ